MRAFPIALRLRLRIETQISHLSPLRRLFVPFSSSSSSSSSLANPRVSNSSFEDEEEGHSAVYTHKLKFQSPSSVRWRSECWNSASFVGTVVQPLKCHDNGNLNLSAYTVLRVGKSPESKGSFQIFLQMRDKMAGICLKHLKENDYIYVSGILGTVAKNDQNGNLRLLYKVLIKELNYVTRKQDIIPQNNKELESVEGGLTILEKYRNRLHLWQIFFSCPHEWWDNRKCKTNPNIPDFKHKDTGEALWLRPNDPPWVKKQLQLLNSRMEVRGEGEPAGHRARLSKWEYDGYD